MLILVLILLLVMTIVGWHLSRDIFAPYVVAPGVWSVIILIYYLLPSELYPIRHDFPIALALWSCGFFVSSCASEYFTSGSSRLSISKIPNMGILKIYVLITLTIVPILCITVFVIALLEDPTAIFRYLRIMNTGLDENIKSPDFGLLVYCVAVAYISLFFVMTYFKKKWIIYSVFFVNMLYAFTSMAKTNFLCVLFASLYLGYVKKIITKKQLLYGFLIFLAICFVVQMARLGNDDFNVMEFLSMYLSSSMVAFDYFAEPASAIHFGENTLRLFYAIAYALGSDIQPIQTILVFVSVPINTNTYTFLYPFYTDFGLVGVFVFSMIYGAFFGFLYKKNKSGGSLGQILYAIFLTFLLLEFIGEFIITNLSLTIQYIVLAVLPFMFSKREEVCKR